MFISTPELVTARLSPLGRAWRGVGRAVARPFALLSRALGTPRRGEALDEASLIKRARRGDHEAFAALVDVHQAWLLNYLTALLGRRADAEDVAQTTLVKAWHALPRFRGDAALRTWLRRIATNEAFNARRRRTEVLLGDTLPEIETPTSGAALVARDALMHVLGTLPYPYRESIVLRHVEELSMEEIAAQTGVGLSAAKMRLKRARERFSEVYARLEVEDDER